MVVVGRVVLQEVVESVDLREQVVHQELPVLVVRQEQVEVVDPQGLQVVQV